MRQRLRRWKLQILTTLLCIPYAGCLLVTHDSMAAHSYSMRANFCSELPPPCVSCLRLIWKETQYLLIDIMATMVWCYDLYKPIMQIYHFTLKYTHKDTLHDIIILGHSSPWSIRNISWRSFHWVCVFDMFNHLLIVGFSCLHVSVLPSSNTRQSALFRAVTLLLLKVRYMYMYVPEPPVTPDYTLLKSDVTRRDHVVHCRGSQECWFTLCQFHSQFHSRRHSLRITLKYTTLVVHAQ